MISKCSHVVWNHLGRELEIGRQKEAQNLKLEVTKRNLFIIINNLGQTSIKKSVTFLYLGEGIKRNFPPKKCKNG